MNTALSLASDLLAMSEMEQRFLRVMLMATPVAVRGETTLVPMSSLQAALGQACSQETVVEAARGLMKMRKLELPGGWTTFALVDSWGLAEEASFLQFQLNQTFLALLKQVAKQEGVELF